MAAFGSVNKSVAKKVKEIEFVIYIHHEADYGFSCSDNEVRDLIFQTIKHAAGRVIPEFGIIINWKKILEKCCRNSEQAQLEKNNTFPGEKTVINKEEGGYM